jgi:hypothetical protein
MHPRRIERLLPKGKLFRRMPHRRHPEGPNMRRHLQQGLQGTHPPFMRIKSKPHRPQRDGLGLKKHILHGHRTVQGPASGKTLLLRLSEEGNGKRALEKHRTLRVELRYSGDDLSILKNHKVPGPGIPPGGSTPPGPEKKLHHLLPHRLILKGPHALPLHKNFQNLRHLPVLSPAAPRRGSLRYFPQSCFSSIPKYGRSRSKRKRKNHKSVVLFSAVDLLFFKN